MPQVKTNHQARVFFLVFDVAKCIRAVNIPSNMQCIYTRPSRLSATQCTEKGHLAICLYALVLLSPAACPQMNTTESRRCAWVHETLTRHLTVLCLGTSHLYCYIARHHETSRRLYPCPTHETFTRHSLLITFLSSRAVLDSAALLYRLSYRGPSRPSALSTRYAGASSRPQASNASVMLPVFFVFPCVLCALPAKRFQTLWVR